MLGSLSAIFCSGKQRPCDVQDNKRADRELGRRIRLRGQPGPEFGSRSNFRLAFTMFRRDPMASVQSARLSKSEQGPIVGVTAISPANFECHVASGTRSGLLAAVDLTPCNTRLELPNYSEKSKLPTLPKPVII
jgi:hypothetical protein